MILDVCKNFVDIQTLFTAFYCNILETPNLSISYGGTSLALSDVGFHFVFHGNAGIFKKRFQMTCGSFMIFRGDHPCAMGFQIACYQIGELQDPQQRLANVLIFSSPNYWGYWGYNLQQMLESDVQNPSTSPPPSQRSRTSLGSGFGHQFLRCHAGADSELMGRGEFAIGKW